MDYKNILYKTKDRIARITLNRPEKLNALSTELVQEYATALREAELDPAVGVVVVRGAGRAFCAGYDIGGARDDQPASITPMVADFTDMRYRLDDTVTTAWKLSKPVIAQVHGYCFAGGNDIAGQCDIIIAAENAQFGMPQIRSLGLSWMHLWPYKCGLQWSKILMFTGDTISGKEAEQLGIAAIAVPEGELEEAVNKLAERIALVDPTELATNKAMINGFFEAAGMRYVMDSAMKLDAIAHTNQANQDFARISKEQGLKAALENRDGPFRASPRPF